MTLYEGLYIQIIFLDIFLCKEDVNRNILYAINLNQFVVAFLIFSKLITLQILNKLKILFFLFFILTVTKQIRVNLNTKTFKIFARMYACFQGTIFCSIMFCLRKCHHICYFSHLICFHCDVNFSSENDLTVSHIQKCLNYRIEHILLYIQIQKDWIQVLTT